MNLMSWILSWVPRETDTPPVDGTPEDSHTDRMGINPEGKPDWCPDKFWDGDLGVRAQPMAEAYRELEGKIRSREDELRERIIEDMKASAPESYEIKLPEDLEIPTGVELNLSDEDPLVQWFFGFAKEKGLSQEDVSSAITEYVKLELAGMPDMEGELAKLGDYGKDRLQRVHNWLDKSLSQEEVQALSPLMTSAESIEALEKLMKGASPMEFESDPPSPAMTLDELRQMQNDPRYWRDKEPTFIKKVEEGYRRLYGRG
jgi:hypothetical protein